MHTQARLFALLLVLAGSSQGSDTEDSLEGGAERSRCDGYNYILVPGEIIPDSCSRCSCLNPIKKCTLTYILQSAKVKPECDCEGQGKSGDNDLVGEGSRKTGAEDLISEEKLKPTVQARRLNLEPPPKQGRATYHGKWV